jgi:hypothetical protein
MRDFIKRRKASRELDLALAVLLLGRNDLRALLKKKYATEWNGVVTDVVNGANSYVTALALIEILILDTLTAIWRRLIVIKACFAPSDLSLAERLSKLGLICRRPAAMSAFSLSHNLVVRDAAGASPCRPTRLRHLFPGDDAVVQQTVVAAPAQVFFVVDARPVRVR